MKGRAGGSQEGGSFFEAGSGPSAARTSRPAFCDPDLRDFDELCASATISRVIVVSPAVHEPGECVASRCPGQAGWRPPLLQPR